MRIIVDGMGGDYAPVEILKGCAMAVETLGVEITVTGEREILEKAFKDNNISTEGIEIEESEGVIKMEDNPLLIRTEKKNTSLGKAFHLLREGKGDALVSAGNSGAVIIGATIIAGRIKGLNRPAFAAVVPTEKGYAQLLDSGANIECTPLQLEQFAVMGSVYMKKMFNIQSPKVGLANNGTEETKGTELYKETFKALANNDKINFIGNVEGRALMLGDADVIVADGFTGNLMLKSAEGACKYFLHAMKDMFSGFNGKLAALLVLKKINALKKRADVKEVGGAPVLGCAKPVIKAHGNSDAKAICSAIRQARDYAASGAIEEITEAFAK